MTSLKFKSPSKVKVNCQGQKNDSAQIKRTMGKFEVA